MRIRIMRWFGDAFTRCWLRRLPSRACHRRHAEGGEFWSDWDQSFESFDQMDLHENLLRGIYAYGGSLHTVGSSKVVSCTVLACNKSRLLGCRL